MFIKRVALTFRERCIHQLKNGRNNVPAGYLRNGRHSKDEVPGSVGIKTIGNLVCCKGRSSDHIGAMLERMDGKYIHKGVWEEWVEEWDDIRSERDPIFGKLFEEYEKQKILQ